MIYAIMCCHLHTETAFWLLSDLKCIPVDLILLKYYISWVVYFDSQNVIDLCMLLFLFM
jgi:hypothetical protein